jgi:acetyl esterase/lipase
MSTEVSTRATTKFHPEHLLDRAAMLAMRAMIALQPTADLGPGGRAAFDALMERTPAAAGAAYEAATVGSVPGWWCRPADVAADAAILYLHGGAYVVGSAQAYRNFVGQIGAKHDPLLTREALESARHFYLGQMDAKDPRVSPLYGDLASLPPVLLHVGEDEILLDDARRYADLSAKSGSTAELHVWPGMVHVFPANLAVLHAAREALDITADFLRRNIAR